MVRFRIRILLLAATAIMATACSKGESPRTESESGESVSPPNTEFSPELMSEDLRTASLNGDIELVMESIEQGVDLNETDPLGRTALMFASFNGHSDIIRFLLENGADVNEQNNEGRTPLMFASSGPFPEAVEYLLQEGADPNVSDSVEGWSPLMYSAAEGNLEVVQILLDHGADASLQDDDGETALDFARNNNHGEVVSLLEENF